MDTARALPSSSRGRKRARARAATRVRGEMLRDGDGP